MASSAEHLILARQIEITGDYLARPVSGTGGPA